MNRYDEMRQAFAKQTQDFHDWREFFSTAWEDVCFEDDIDALRRVTIDYYGPELLELDETQDECMAADVQADYAAEYYSAEDYYREAREDDRREFYREIREDVRNTKDEYYG